MTSGQGNEYNASWITRWVLFVSRHARLTLALIAVCTLVAALAAVQLFSLNSDTSQLIKPGPETRWHQQDLEFNAAFPQF